RNFGAALSALLRTIVELKLTSVDQLTYSEFVFSLENPTCFNLINAAPLEGQLILDINLSLLFPIIDRLLGGGNDAGTVVRRPLTEIELRLVSRITDLFCKEVKHAWENVLELDLTIDHVESNPQLVQIVPPNEVVVLISFELSIGDARGMMNFCIPFNSIERIATRLSSNSWVSYGKKTATPENIKRISGQLSDALVEVVVDLADTTISTSDLIGLRVGDIIATEKDTERPLVVSVEGRPKFHAKAGAFKGRKAIQVVGMV
ncbi:MAG: flagellar motor switch protein FliM, partial [Planctomycetia bacterium]|nr:flagellar motor switch protein FliM [Planctomycetia bacterium]